jgi:predicted P-loop ATPase
MSQPLLNSFNDEPQDNSPGSGSVVFQMEQYLVSNYDFRYNIITGRVQYSLKDDEEFIDLDDQAQNSMFIALKKAKVKCTMSLLHSLLHSEFSFDYNPFAQYFSNLEEWDEKEDYIKNLAGTVKTTNDAFWTLCLKKWLVALVACAIDDKVENQTVIVFTGKQGVGKTTWQRNLVPASLKSYMHSGYLNPDNKDTSITLSESLLILMDELESLSRTQIGALKELISRANSRVRRPYGRNHECLVRRASFIGSVNTAHFLNDSTGNRRFLCFEVTDIDYAKVDIGKVYAQAFHLYRSGFQYWFEKNEIKEINRNNEDYQILPPEEELLLKHYRKPTKSNEGVLLSTTDLALAMGLKAEPACVKRLGMALNKHCYLKKKRNGKQLYLVLSNLVPVNESRSFSNNEDLLEN